MPTIGTDHASPQTAASKVIERKGVILALVCLAQFMVLLDISIVNVALPSMRAELGLSVTGLQWVVNAYTLTFAGLLLLGGRAADIFGQRKIFLLGIFLFGSASLVGGLANNETVLIIARAAQGVGGAVLSPATLTILTTTFAEGRERSKAMGMWSAVAGAGGTAGAILGGVITDLIDWRWIFFLNVPIAAIAFVAGFRLLKARNERHARGLDAMGALLVTAGLITLVYAIVSTELYGWLAARTVGTFIASLVLLGWFVFHEAKVAKEPLMPLSLWKYPSLAVANITMFFMATGMFAMWFLLSLTMQNVLDYSALKAGFAFAPQTFAIIVAAQISSRIMHKVGPRLLIVVGTLASAAGLAWLAQMPVDATFLRDIFVPGILTTFGLGLAMTPIITLAMAGVQRHEAGLASGVINTSRQIGGAIGLAALSTIAASRTSEMSSANELSALVSGYDRGLLVGAALVAVATISCLFLPKPKRSSEQSVEVGAAAAEA